MDRDDTYLDDYIKLVPESAMIRGMFFSWIHEFCLSKKVAHSKKRYIDFKLYPVKEFLGELNSSLAPIAAKDGIKFAAREYGRFIFPFFRQSLLGHSMLSAKLTPQAVFGIAPRAYKVLTEGVEMSVHIVEPGLLTAHYKNLWVLNDSLGVGTWEGVLQGLNLEGDVRVISSDDRCQATLEIRWTKSDEARPRMGRHF